ncbi:hypothetical protein JCM5350_000632 [Sporobolomyces pararoseus]
MSAEMVQLRGDIRVTQEYMIVFVAIIIWDTIATWPGEYRYLWKQDWSSLKAIFLVNRYWSVIARVVTMALVLASIPSGACEKIFWIEIFNSLSIMLLCGILVCFRLYKTYNQSRKIAMIFGALLFVQMGVMTGAASQLRAYSTPVEWVTYLSAPGCSTGNPRINARLLAALYWTPPLLFHMSAFGAILYHDLSTTRRAGKWALAQRLADEGAFNLFVIVCSLIPNIALFIQSNVNLINLNAPASLTLTSLMCSRMVLAQFIPSTIYSNDAPSLAIRPSANQGSNGTTEPYSVTFNSVTTGTVAHLTPKMRGNELQKDLETGRASEEGVEPTAFTPVLGKDDRPHANREEKSDEEDEKDKSESSSRVGVGLGMTV